MTLKDWKDIALCKIEQAMNSLEVEGCSFDEHELTQAEEETLNSYIDESIRYIEHAREYIWCAEPNEEDIKANLILDLISDKDNYSNEDKACNCSKCEIKSMCNYTNKFQRLGREKGGLGLCHKLNELTFYDFVENHLEKYKLIVDTRREKHQN